MGMDIRSTACGRCFTYCTFLPVTNHAPSSVFCVWVLYVVYQLYSRLEFRMLWCWYEIGRLHHITLPSGILPLFSETYAYSYGVAIALS